MLFTQPTCGLIFRLTTTVNMLQWRLKTELHRPTTIELTDSLLENKLSTIVSIASATIVIVKKALSLSTSVHPTYIRTESLHAVTDRLWQRGDTQGAFHLQQQPTDPSVGFLEVAQSRAQCLQPLRSYSPLSSTHCGQTVWPLPRDGPTLHDGVTHCLHASLQHGADQASLLDLAYVSSVKGFHMRMCTYMLCMCCFAPPYVGSAKHCVALSCWL